MGLFGERCVRTFMRKKLIEVFQFMLSCLLPLRRRDIARPEIGVVLHTDEFPAPCGITPLLRTLPDRKHATQWCWNQLHTPVAHVFLVIRAPVRKKTAGTAVLRADFTAGDGGLFNSVAFA